MQAETAALVAAVSFGKGLKPNRPKDVNPHQMQSQQQEGGRSGAHHGQTPTSSASRKHTTTPSFLSFQCFSHISFAFDFSFAFLVPLHDLTLTLAIFPSLTFITSKCQV